MIIQELKGFVTSKRHGSIENLHSKLHANIGDASSGREINLCSIKRSLYSSMDSVLLFCLFSFVSPCIC